MHTENPRINVQEPEFVRSLSLHNPSYQYLIESVNCPHSYSFLCETRDLYEKNMAIESCYVQEHFETIWNI